jgi:CBS domain-containing protein
LRGCWPTYRVHAIFVHTRSGESPDEESWGVVTDADVLVAALGGVMDSPAACIARTPVLAVRTTEPLERAVQLMNEHEVAHLVVVEGHSGRPIGVVSTLDIARTVAGHP